jgi:hypothetical protein
MSCRPGAGVHIIKSDQPAPENINARVLAAQPAAEPVISVDTKKKEFVGNYKNGGTDYRQKGEPVCVKAHDFEDKTLGKVAPLYDVTADEAWVSVGITADTAAFAVQSIRTRGEPGSSAPRP